MSWLLRIVVVAFYGGAWAFALVIGFQHLVVAGAQEAPVLPTNEPQAAYLLDHPINPDWLILATREGRWSITRLDDCAWAAGDMNVDLQSGYPLAREIDAVGQEPCAIGILSQVDVTACYTNELGECDVNLEHNW
jgi:hypothetical protein